MKRSLRFEQKLVFVVLFGLVSCQTSSNNVCQQPMNCVSDGLNSTVTFQYQPGATQVLMSMSTRALNGSGWMAVAFSYDNRMGLDSVVDCMLFSNGSIVVKNSYNQAHNNTDIAEPYLGIEVVNTSYANGILQCVLKRSLTVNSNSGQIYNLTQAYYILIAHGSINDQGRKMYHRPANRYYSQDAVLVTKAFLVPRDRSYYLDKLGNVVSLAYLPDSGEIEVEFEGPVNRTARWISLGFSNDQSMGDDSVLDCLLLTNGSLSVQNSYNLNGAKSNIPLDSVEGITVIMTSYENGTMYCACRRKIANFSNSQIFSLDKPYYFLLGDGDLLPDGTKKKHGHTPVISAYPVDVQTVSGNVSRSDEVTPFSQNRHYFLDKLGNIVSFMYLNDSGEIEFTFEGPVNNTARWISLGFSKDASMGDDSVLDCLLLANGSLSVQNSYNLYNDKRNVPLNSVEGITVLNTSYVNGAMYCACRRQIANFSNSQIFSLDKSYYLMLGDGKLLDDGTKVMHGHTPVVSFNQVDVRSAIGNVSRSDDIFTSLPPPPPSPLTTTASAVPSGFSSFPDDNGNQVLYRLSDDGTSVEFRIEGPPVYNAWWIAVGFSTDQKMGVDSVLDCIHTQDGTFVMQNSYNDNAGRNLVVNKDGIKVLTTSYSGSKMSCDLTRAISSNNSQIYPFNDTYYLLLAAGPLSDTGEKMYHGVRRSFSKEKVNLTIFQIVSSSDQKNLIRAHGCLMITAFVMLMSGAIIIARYYKTCWPEDKLCGTAVWFSVHRFIMVIGLFSCAAGFIIIFCYSGGKIKGFADGSPSYFWAHGPMGIAVMILIAMNPIMAIFRCDPDGDKRWIFNWMHWFVGTCCQVLAGITLFFGIKIGESESYHLNHLSVFWILIAFVGFHVFIELVLLIERDVSQRYSRRNFTVTYGMSSPGEPPTPVKQDGSSRESIVFRYFVLALYALITMGLWLAMIILIGGGFQAGNKSN